MNIYFLSQQELSLRFKRAFNFQVCLYYNKLCQYSDKCKLPGHEMQIFYEFRLLN